MKLMTGYEFVDAPDVIELCPVCKQTRLMPIGRQKVCYKDGSRHQRGIEYRRVGEEEPPGSVTARAAARRPARSRRA